MNLDNSNSKSNEILKYRHKKGDEDYNILLISEKDQLAYLPYFYADVKNIYETNKEEFNSIQDVISKLYTIPLSNFQNSTFSRFRESFNLVRNIENKSIIKALDLGLELMFQYNLNPIIIRACRNIDELDLYLAYLDTQELNNFDCFEIHFEINPLITK